MIVETIVVLGGLGLLFGIVLAIASKRFEVKKDLRVEQVRNALPGSNCGACGYAGCDGYAEAVALNSDVPVNLCIPGQKKVAEEISKIIGRESKSDGIEEKVAFVRCAGGSRAKDKAQYCGIASCKGASSLFGGQKACSYGCLGFGDCVSACSFGAIKMGADRLAKVDPVRCVACGACMKACPKGLFVMVPKKKKIHVRCSSKDPAAKVAKSCSIGCIACRLCEKSCPAAAIAVVDNLAVIDYSKCIMCGKCVTTCPRKLIIDQRR